MHRGTVRTLFAVDEKVLLYFPWFRQYEFRYGSLGAGSKLPMAWLEAFLS